MAGQVEEIFLAFLNGGELPSYVIWRPALGLDV
jgi:hypothetical protein